MSRSIRNKQQGGFVLVLTIAVIAIGLLASGFVARWIESEFDNFNRLSSTLQQKVDQHNTLSTIIYVAATRPMTYAGIAFTQTASSGFSLPMDENGDINVGRIGNEIRLDDRIYQGLGGALFQIQDEAGLISVNTLTEDRIRSLFTLADIDRDNIPTALGTLYDYIDTDDEYRPDGAETRQYLRANMTGPANRRLRTPEELVSIYGWKEMMSVESYNQISAFLTAKPVVPININTAPKESLLVLGLTPQDVDRVISFRETQDISFANISSVIPVVNESLDVDLFQYYASRSLRVSIRSNDSSRADVYYLQISTQIEDEKPWNIRYKTTNYVAPVINSDIVSKTGNTIFDG